MTDSLGSASTSDSKAQRYADAAVKAITLQYSSTIKELNAALEGVTAKLDERDEVIKALQQQLPSTSKDMNVTTQNGHEPENETQSKGKQHEPVQENDDKKKDHTRQSDDITASEQNTAPHNDNDNTANDQGTEDKIVIIEEKYGEIFESKQDGDSTPLEEKGHSLDTDSTKVASPPRKKPASDGKSPFRKGFDDKDNYSVQDPAINDQKKQKVVSPDNVPRRKSSRLQQLPTPNDGGRPAL